MSSKSMATINAKLILPALIVAGYYGTQKLGNKDGLFALIDQTAQSGKLPNSDLPMIAQWTGLKGIDYLFQVMVSFFYPAIDGNAPTYTLQAVHFGGQLIAMYTLMVVESFRVGNAWGVVSFISLWGLGMEFVAIPIILPLLCLTHLFKSPTAASTTKLPLALRKTSLLIHPTELQVLPWAITIGHLLPVFLTLYFRLTTPTQADSAGQVQIWRNPQLYLIIRLFHPILTSIAQITLSALTHKATPTGPNAPKEYPTAAQRNRHVLRSLSSVYTFATSIAIILHIAPLTLSLCARYFPTLLEPEFSQAITPYNVWSPMWAWPSGTIARTGKSYSVGSVAEGAHYFLQWDEIVSCASILIWALAVNRNALSDQESGTTVMGFFGCFFKTGLMCLVGGPACAAIYLIWERDVVLLDVVDEREEAGQGQSREVEKVERARTGEVEVISDQQLGG